jgi:hypothetical protein
MRRTSSGSSVSHSNGDMPAGGAEFVVLVESPAQIRKARVLIQSIRAFGGPLSGAQVRLFVAGDAVEENAALATEFDALRGEDPAGVHLSAISENTGPTRGYWFGEKVRACAMAEEMAAPGVQSLLWLAPESLVCRPPVLLMCDPPYDAALRPVHVQNVGLASDQPLDGFWREIYRRVGVDDIGARVESFVELRQLRGYWNSGLFSLNPATGIFRKWAALFEDLVGDSVFQAGPCADPQHRIFLHQAVLSAILAVRVPPERIRPLPPEYGYPIHLHHRVPRERRASAMNELVCPLYEDEPLDSREMNGIEIREPLRSWIARWNPDPR